MLQVKLFGIGRVLSGDTEIKLRSRTWTLPLLAYFALHRAETVPRWRVAFTLWPDEPEESALQNLRRNLHLLIRALPERGEPWLLVDAESIGWNTAAEFRLDVAEYERLRADPATLEEAVALYGGDLLEESYDDWIVTERERLRRLYHADLSALIAVNRSRRAFGPAIEYAQRLLGQDPFREDTLRQLMEARYESGDAAGALAEYNRFARLLDSEMNVAPMQETVALSEAIMRGAPIPGAPDTRRTPKPRAAPATPFVGREKELAELRAHWSRAARGDGSLVMVRGEAGIGKSRLVSELALVVEAEGGRVFEGGTSSPERGPYECVVEALRQALVMIEALVLPPQVLTVIAELVPQLRSRRPDLPTAARLDDRSERARLFAAVGSVVTQLARPRPVLAILEDLHWADTATIELVGSLAREIAASPVLLVATYRDDEVVHAGAFHEIERGAAAARVVVGPLTSAAVTALSNTIAPVDSDDPNFPRAVYERSEGNPLFATEMLRDAARGAYDPTAIPTSVGALIGTRFATLRREAQSLVRVAAVAGTTFAFDTVREGTGFSASATLSALDELFDRHLVRESTGRGRDEYAFTHHLIRGAIYDEIPPTIRSRHHLRIGHVLQAMYAGEEFSGEIALHCELGGDRRAAATWYLAAARHAASLYANVEARDFATRGLQLAPEGEVRLIFDLVSMRQAMNARLAERESQRVDLAEMIRLSSGLDDETALTALRRYAEYAHVFCSVDEEAAAVSRLWERAETSGEARWTAVATELRAGVATRRADAEAILSDALAARAIYERAGDAAGQVRALSLASGAYTSLGRHDEALRRADEARSISVATGDPALQIVALAAAFTQAYENQQFARAAEFSREQLRLSREMRDRFRESTAHGTLASSLWHLWQVDEALEHGRKSRELHKAMGFAYGSAGLANRAGLLGDLGAFDEALRLFEEAHQLARRIGRPIVELTSSVDRARVLWQCGAIAEMRHAVEHAAQLAREFERQPSWWFLHVLNQGRLLRHDGRYRESAELLESVLPDMRALGRPVDEITATDELAESYLGSDRVKEAVAAVEASVALAAHLEDPATMRHPVEHYWIAANVYRAAGDAERFEGALKAAERVYCERRDAIGDPSLRSAFEEVPLHKTLRSTLR